MKLKNKIKLIFTIIILVLFIIPLILVKLSKPHEFMGLMVLLFFIINPITTIIVNSIIGKDMKKIWYMPITFSAFFLLFYWIILKEIILDLLVYAIGYLVIGIICMFVSFLITKNKK